MKMNKHSLYIQSAFIQDFRAKCKGIFIFQSLNIKQYHACNCVLRSNYYKMNLTLLYFEITEKLHKDCNYQMKHKSLAWKIKGTLTYGHSTFKGINDVPSVFE
jgi:hypothetical protein